MGKRQIRIPGKNIMGNAAILTGKEVNLQLKNNAIFHGVVIEVNGQAVSIKDKLLKKHIFPISHIEEIITDKETLY